MDIRPYIYLIVLILGFLIFFRKVRKHPIIIIFIVYLANAILSTFIDYKHLKFFGWHPESYTYYGYLLYSLGIFICLLPIIKLHDYSPAKQPFKLNRPFQYFLLFWFILSIYSILYHLPYAFDAITNNVADIRQILNAKKESILPQSPLTTIAVAVAAFYNFFLFIFFKLLSSKYNYSKLLFFCFIASLTYVVSSLTFGARDGLLFYILSTLFAFLLHKKSMTPKVSKKVVRLVLFFSLSFAFLLGRFTYQRFIEKSKMSISDGLKFGVVSYFGEQPYVFNEGLLFHEKTGKYYGHSQRFPLLNPILGEEIIPKRKLPVEWSFGSFLKDFYDANGLKTMIPLVALFFSFFYYNFSRWKYYHPLRNIILISFYWQFLLSGVFFFNLGSFAGNVTILAYLFTFWGLKFIYPNRIDYTKSSTI